MGTGSRDQTVLIKFKPLRSLQVIHRLINNHQAAIH